MVTLNFGDKFTTVFEIMIHCLGGIWKTIRLSWEIKHMLTH